MTTADELHHAAKQLANTYDRLNTLADTPPRPTNVRKMKPTFGPQSPTNDQDWTLNLTHELMRETPNEKIPGGLATMAKDALQYTPAPRHTPNNTGYCDDHITPGLLCAHIAAQAPHISTKYPAADDLHDLLQAQHHYLTQTLTRRYGRGPDAPEARHTSTIIVAMLGQQGIPITRQHLHTWAQRGHITQQTNNQGRPTYKLSEVIAWASRQTANNQH